MSGLSRTWLNMAIIARREFAVRVRTRSFKLGTALLVIGAVAIALLPVIVQSLDRLDHTRIAVAAESPSSRPPRS